MRGASSAHLAAIVINNSTRELRGRQLISQALGLGTMVPQTYGMTFNKAQPPFLPQFPHLYSQALLTQAALTIPQA